MDSHENHYTVCLWTAPWVDSNTVDEINRRIVAEIETVNKSSASFQLHRIIVEHSFEKASTPHIRNALLEALGDKENDRIRLSACAYRTLCKEFGIIELPHICIVDQDGRRVDLETFDSSRISNIVQSAIDTVQVLENEEEMKQRMKIANKLFENGHYLEATKAFSQLLSSWKASTQISFNLAVALQTLGEHYFSISYIIRVIEMEDEDTVAHNVLTSICHSNEPQAVISAYEKVVSQYSSHVHARHCLASLTNNAKTASSQYVQAVFDQLADTFDDKLVNHLEYRVPWLLVDALLKHEPKLALEKVPILDIGCGTGLCGILLKRFASRLIGVDLSSRMIQKAQATGSYDELQETSLVLYLQEQAPNAFQLIVAADVWIYVGVLEETFKLCHNALEKGGWLLFSIEVLSGGIDGVKLATSGRFQHSVAYIEQLSLQTGFRIITQESVSLRKESMHSIEGCIFILCKK